MFFLPLLESRDVVQQKLQEAVTAHHGYQEQMSQLKIVAPFPGDVVSVTDNLTPGSWVSDKLPLATLIDKTSISGYAYITEQELTRIEKNATAYFYAENPALDAVPMQIEEIDRASVTSLHEQPVLTSTFDGPIATRESDSGHLVPEHALYRIRLSIDQLPADLKTTELRGTAHIEAHSSSWASDIWRQVTAVFIRESGF